MKTKRPIGITILAIFLVWSAIKALGMIFRSDSLDAQLFSSYNLSLIYYVYGIAIIILGGYLAWALWKAKKNGYKTFFWFTGVNILYATLGLVLGFASKDQLVDFYTKSRISRGLHVNNVEIAAQFPIILISSIVGILFYLGISYYIYKKKDHFTQG